MEKCLRLNTNYVPSKKIGKGEFGTVYLEKEGKYVMKVSQVEGKDCFPEVPIQNDVATKLHIAPEVIDAWVCEESGKFYGVLVSRRLGLTFKQYMEQKPRCKDVLAIIGAVVKAIDMIQSIGIYHTDYNIDNIMIDTTPNPLKVELSIGTRYVYIIDYGMAKRAEASDADSLEKFENDQYDWASLGRTITWLV